MAAKETQRITYHFYELQIHKQNFKIDPIWQRVYLKTDF
jgi:hypothetical protein